MIALDTNVLVRYVAQDDPAQSPKATALIESLSEDSPGFISLVVLAEMVWVVQGAYQASKAEIVAVLEKLLRINALVLENSDAVMQALRLYIASKSDFADCLIARSARQAGCERVFTFDTKAAKTAGMTLLA